MEEVTFSVPAMWADHHVLAIREALGQVAGVKEVLASAMYKDVLVKYDPATATPKDLEKALAEAGYELDKVPDLSNFPARIDDASAWYQFQERITTTDMRDLTMSGDHRKY
jgi:copper chaperone CopZ